jgi:hypothetical protein
MTSAELPSQPSDFIVTKEYRRFAEFCDACREARYMGSDDQWNREPV